MGISLRQSMALLSVPGAAFGAFAAAMASPSLVASSLEPFFFRGYGSTLYRLEMTFPLTENGQNTADDDTKGLGQSELEYPLNAFAAGLRYRYDATEAEGRSPGYFCGLWSNFSHPSSKMEDTDWFGATSSSGSTTVSALYKFSDTHSRVEMRWYGGEAGFDIGGYRLFGKPMRLGLAVRADRMTYNVFGVQGWQRLPDEAPVIIDTLSGEIVLTYALLRVMPRAFAEFSLAQGARAQWKAAFSAAPALAFDHDDHVLRKKDSHTSAYGFELGASSEFSYRITPNADLVAAADLAYLRTKGDMDQHFYGDDPATSADETGQSLKNITTRIIGLGGGVSLGCRYLF